MPPRSLSHYYQYYLRPLLSSSSSSPGTGRLGYYYGSFPAMSSFSSLGAVAPVSPSATEQRDPSSAAPPPPPPRANVVAAPPAWESEWQSLAEEEETTVVVPRDGWYSLFFGHAVPIYCAADTGGKKPKKRKLPVVTNNAVAADKANVLPVRNDLPVMAYLSILPKDSSQQQPTTTTETDNKCNPPLSATTEEASQRNRIASLPWREPSASTDHALLSPPPPPPPPPQLLDPPSFHLGRLVWLYEGSRLAVTVNCRDAVAHILSALWKVRFHHASHTPPPPPQDPFDCKRPWVCHICQKTFPIAHRVSQHQEVSHYEEILRGQAAAATTTTTIGDDDEGRKEKDSSLMWTTPLAIAYNDDYLAVVMKPQGMAVMGHYDGPTLQRSSLLLALAPAGLLQKPKIAFTWPARESTAEAVQDSYFGKPRAVHRLDAPTGGLLVVAKTRQTESTLKRAFADRHVHKTYWALVYGKIAADTGQCDQSLSGKPSLTHYKVLQRTRSLTSKDGWLTTVELSPVTGRQHQLRRHMQLMGHGLWGDARYGPRMADKTASLHSRLCLWALAIRFTHPVTGQDVSCRMDEPEWLQHVVQEEESSWQQAQPSDGRCNDMTGVQ